jgi:hypothetical protein
MGKMKVKVAGQDLFDWAGDEVQIADLEKTFRDVMADNDAPTDGTAAAAVDDLVQSGLAEERSARDVHSMAVVYFLLQQDTRTPARPGRIRDYLPAWDFECDLRRRADGGVSIRILGTSEAWS